MCCHVGVVLKVYFVSQRSLKSVEEAPGDGLFKKGVSASLCKEVKEVS